VNLVNWPKWRRSITRRHDRIVRLLGMPQRATSNYDHETNVRRWRKDGAENRLRYEYDLTAEDVVFDLGGFMGHWTAEISARFGCQVHVFEPVPDYYEAIRRRFARNRRIHVHRFGLANSTCTTKLGVAGEASSHWHHSPKTVQAELRDAVAFLETHQCSHVSLCKINIEGAEYDLLDHLLDAQVISRFGNLQIQFHTFVPHAVERMTAIQRRLAATHVLTYQYPFVWENWQLRSENGSA